MKYTALYTSLSLHFLCEDGLSVCLFHTQPNLNVLSCDLTLTRRAVTNHNFQSLLAAYLSIGIIGLFHLLAFPWHLLFFFCIDVAPKLVNCKCCLPSLKLITISHCKKYCSKHVLFSRAFLQESPVTTCPPQKKNKKYVNWFKLVDLDPFPSSPAPSTCLSVAQLVAREGRWLEAPSRLPPEVEGGPRAQP